MPHFVLPLALALNLALGSGLALANTAGDAPAQPRSALDAPLFYQLLIGEIELQKGRAPQAFDILLDAARRSRDESLFKRAVQIGLQTRSTDRVQSAIRLWRTTLPQSTEALGFQLQLSLSLGRAADAAEALVALVDKSPTAAARSQVLASLAALTPGGQDRKAMLAAFEPALKQLAQREGLKADSLAALGHMQWAAGQADQALASAEQAHALQPTHRNTAVLALDLLPRLPQAEAIVRNYLARATDPDGRPDASLRLAYGQALAQANRHADAQTVLKQVNSERPDLANAWLTLGAVQLELRQPLDAEQSLKRYLDVAAEARAQPEAKPAEGPPGTTPDEEDDTVQRMMRAAAASAGRNQAYLMLSQAAEQRGDAQTAAIWLEKVEDHERGLSVVARRASLLAKQGKVAEGRALIKAFPEATADDARAKLVAESQLLRDVKRWQDAHDVLAEGVKRFPKDVDLIYEQGMMAEKLDRMADMERLLRQVIALKPDHHHAYNALGYSLADRGQRLDEARTLVKKALDLAPGDPFITDSLGWIEFRLGNRAEALRLLKQAWATRPDSEIGAHLGEALWVQGERDEARRIWRESRTRDATNDVLKETLKRLKVDL